MTDSEPNTLDDLLEVDEGLRAKDIEFLESLDKKRHFDLSPKQLKWLQDLEERHL